MAEWVGFKVDGSFVTDMSRKWFWGEGRPYEVCEELLLNCLVTDQLTLDERKEIARDILEGKSKLTGINTFMIEDDGEKIRPIRMKTDAVVGKVEVSYYSQIQRVIDYTSEWLREHEKPDESAEASYIVQYDTMQEIKGALEDSKHMPNDRDRMYLILPDDYDEWEGLIAPNGDFYSCDFGGHNAKAYFILYTQVSKFPNFDYANTRHINPSNALDCILDQGWCATRFLPSVGAYIEPRTDGRPLTKAQENAIFDAKIAHDVSVDLSPIGY